MTEPLPSHPQPGLTVEAGDRVELTGLRFSVDNWYEPQISLERAVVARVPEWVEDFPVGYSFALTQKLPERTFAVDGNRVQVSNSGWAIDVGLASTVLPSLRNAFVVANRTLDILATNRYEISGLYQPLFEYASWHQSGSDCVLSRFTWLRIRFRAEGSLQARRPDGTIRTSGEPVPRAWHPSHAFFRRSQLTEDLHEAYRNLFLALEAVLSGPLPPVEREGERKWLRRALKRVVTEYGLDLSRFIEGSSSNPLDTFLDEQYRAIRCALFHAKISRDPILPDELAPRNEIMVAMRRLGSLYVEVSRRVTGANFAGGGAGQSVFQDLVNRLASYPVYVSPESAFTTTALLRNQPIVSEQDVEGKVFPALRAEWGALDLPERLLRFGSTSSSDAGEEELWFAPGTIETTRADRVELVLVFDLANASQPRQSYA